MAEVPYRAQQLPRAPLAAPARSTDYDHDPGKPVCAWNDRADIDRVVSELVNDAHTILAVLDGADLDDAQAEAVGLLALVAGQTSNMAMRMGRGGSRR